MRQDGERRQQQRISAKKRLAFCESTMGKRTYTVKDLSVGGVRLTRGPKIPIGTDVSIAILNGADKPIRAHGRVVHKSLLSFGVAFDPQDSPDAQLLEILRVERRR